ncbi:MAG: Verru_Chthon cassette protein C [Verrucomicrobiales bacterium]|nr:Verru_Chthon cassette protein C [Verrucomicrobiales bacterium]
MTKLKFRAVKRGFSLIELMVAMGILSVLMLMMTVLLDQVQQSWRYSESRISQFREARVAFDLISKSISQASLNTYFDLDDKDGDGIFDQYYRTSELHFQTMEAARLTDVSGNQTPVGHAVFFQAPLGFSTNYRNLNNLFNGRGYFVAYGPDTRFRPAFIDSPPNYRFRLMEFRPPAESNQVFEDGALEREQGMPQEFTQWFKQSVPNVGDSADFEEHLNPLAKNILTLVVSPRDSPVSSSGGRDDNYSEIARYYSFDSNDSDPDFASYSQQVPPLVRLTMVAIDEEAGSRFEEGSSIPDLMPQGYFTDTAKYQSDIENLTDSLNEKRVNHKIFSTMVMLRSAKWSVN